MKFIWPNLEAITAVVGGFLGWLFGGIDGLVFALITFVVLDYLTGVLVAIVERKLSSEVGARGIAKKVTIFALIGIAHLIDQFVLHSGATLRTAIVFFYIANECLSVIENSVRLGLPVPAKFKEVLEQIRNNNDGGTTNEPA